MTPADDLRFVARIRDAGADAAWPPTPDLRAAVVARIEREGLRPHPVARPTPTIGAGGDGMRRRMPRRLGRALVLAIVALLVVAGIAIALGFRLPGLDVVFVDRLLPAGGGLDLGTPVSLADARAVDPPRVLVPAALRAPDEAFIAGAGARRIVTLPYRSEAGQPSLAGSDLALTVMALPGDVNETLVTKLLGPGTTIEPVTVGGTRGWWIAGAPHEIVVELGDGTVGPLHAALAGDTLVFARDGTLYRLESALGRDATLAIAASMR